MALLKETINNGFLKGLIVGMANNPCNDARRGAHVVCRWGGVIKWKGLASPSLGRI
jgi:hypothetical protein